MKDVLKTAEAALAALRENGADMPAWWPPTPRPGSSTWTGGSSASCAHCLTTRCLLPVTAGPQGDGHDQPL